MIAVSAITNAPPPSAIHRQGVFGFGPRMVSCALSFPVVCETTSQPCCSHFDAVRDGLVDLVGEDDPRVHRWDALRG